MNKPSTLSKEQIWAKNSSYTSKSYKLKKDLVESFKKACEHQGISQASALSEFMNSFIESHKIQSSK